MKAKHLGDYADWLEFNMSNPKTNEGDTICVAGVTHVFKRTQWVLKPSAGKIYLFGSDPSWDGLKRDYYATNEEEIAAGIATYIQEMFGHEAIMDSFEFIWEDKTVRFRYFDIDRDMALTKWYIHEMTNNIDQFKQTL